jgi:hypothetical protein
MLKQEWKSYLPHDELVDKVAKHTFDIAEYIMQISKSEVGEPLSII